MSDTTHLLIPYAASASPGCQQAQQGLALPHLERLLARLSPHPAQSDSGEETSFSAPMNAPWPARWACLLRTAASLGPPGTATSKA